MYMKNKYKIVDFFKGYAGGGHTSPEVWLETHVIPNISSNVEFVVDFGCANGRNFIPFKDYKCIGFDMYQPEEINYSYNFEYHVSSIEDFSNYTNSIKWEKSLVMSHGTLMYCTNSKVQNNFIKALREKGCKNFVFHEYTSDKLIKNGNLSERARNGGLGYLDLNYNNSQLFHPPLGNKINFRDIENDMHALISLEK